jgi:hypothetical protein
VGGDCVGDIGIKKPPLTRRLRKEPIDMDSVSRMENNLNRELTPMELALTELHDERTKLLDLQTRVDDQAEIVDQKYEIYRTLWRENMGVDK